MHYLPLMKTACLLSPGSKMSYRDLAGNRRQSATGPNSGTGVLLANSEKALKLFERKCLNVGTVREDDQRRC